MNVPGASAVVLQLDLIAVLPNPTTIDVLGAEYSVGNAAVNGKYLDINIQGLRVSFFC